MKRKISLMILSLCLIGSLVGCSTEKKTDSKFIYSNDSIKLANYKGLNYSDVKVETKDEDVESQIQENLKANAEYQQITEGTVKDGDTVNVDYVGTMNGEEFAGGTYQGYNLEIGSNSFIEGFEEGIVGMNVGDQKTLNLSFPADYGDENLNGKAVDFAVTLNYICGEKNIIPELNDEFVQKVSNESKTIDEYKKEVKEQLESGNSTTFVNNVRNSLLNQLVANSEFKKISEKEVEKYISAQKKYYEQYATMFNLNYEDFVKQYFNLTEEELNKQLKTDAEQSVKMNIIFEAIVENEKIKLSDDEYKKALEKMATDYGYSTIKDLKKALLETYTEDEIKKQCLYDKAYDVVFKSAKYVESKEDTTIQTENDETTTKDKVETDVESTTESESK